MKKTIIICEYISTGINYVDDARARGYEPVLVEGTYVGSPDDIARFKAIRETINRRIKGKVLIIPENPNYDEILAKVRTLNPALVVAGSEFGVDLATRLAADLGLPGNPVESIPAMTEKPAMHQALKDYGIRYIHGEVVTNEEDAIAFYRELDNEYVVVKPARGAGSQGVYMCCGEEEMLEGVRRHFKQCIDHGNEPSVLIQERIDGEEYVVNTVSCNGEHRIVTVGKYDKYKMDNRTIAYNYFRYVTNLDIGNSRLLQYACQVADAIGIKYGPIHGEYMVDEKGPVLIEVNCRPMGGGLERKYSELISGQHETDSALDSYLDPDKFHYDAQQPYRLKRCGVSKDLVLAKDTLINSAPVLQICMRLKSYYSATFGEIGRTNILSETTDMETEAGLIYLLHDDESQVRYDCELLHTLEIKYPKILYQGSSEEAVKGIVERDIDEIVKAAGGQGTTLIFSDTLEDYPGVAVVKTNTLMAAYDSYDQGILDLSDSKSYVDLESIIQQIFVFMDKIRVGGKIFIPPSTYCHLPYGIEGMEILLKVSGLLIELPMSEAPDLLVATVQ